MALQVSPPPLLSFFVAFPLITNHTVPLPPILKKKKALSMLFVVSSVYVSCYGYFQVSKQAGLVLLPSCIWISIASFLGKLLCIDSSHLISFPLNC